MISAFFVRILALLILPSLVLLALKWISAPVRLRKKNPVPIQGNLEPTSIATLTPEMRDSIGDYVRQFTAEGFSTVANLTHRRGPGEPWSVSLLFVDRATNDTGVVVFASAKLSRNCVFAIRSEFADGAEIATGYNREVSSLPRNPRSNLARFSWARDVATIAEAHRRRLKQLGRFQDQRVAPVPGTESEYATARRDEELRHFVRCGYYYRDEPAGVLRKTWKGSCLVAWKMMSPIKGWRMRYGDRQSRKLWNELGMQDWEPAPALYAEVPALAPDGVEGTDSVSYQSRLAPGELRVSQERDSTVVRLGQPSIGAYVGINWVRVVGIALYAFLTAWASFNFWLEYRLVSRIAQPFRTLLLTGWPREIAIILLFLVLAIWQAQRLLRALPICRRHINSRRVSCRNAFPGRPVSPAQWIHSPARRAKSADHSPGNPLVWIDLSASDPTPSKPATPATAACDKRQGPAGSDSASYRRYGDRKPGWRCRALPGRKTIALT